jgi:hypothetical protein
MYVYVIDTQLAFPYTSAFKERCPINEIRKHISHSTYNNINKVIGKK